jgi:hypothetical protein
MTVEAITAQLDKAQRSGHAGSRYVDLIEEALLGLIDHYRDEYESLGYTRQEAVEHVHDLVESL